MNANSPLLKEFERTLKAQGKLEATAASYRRDVCGFLKFLQFESMNDFAKLNSDDLLAYQQFLQISNGCSNSIRRAIIGVKQFFRFLNENNQLMTNPFDDIPIPPRDEALDSVLDERTINTILHVTTNENHLFKQYRDQALIHLLAFEGVKATEVIQLNWGDYLYMNGIVSLRVIGARKRIIQLEQKSSTALNLYYNSWIEEKGHILNHNGTKCAKVDNDKARLFVSFKGKDGKSVNHELTRHGLKFMLYEVGAKIGKPHLNTEMLRHFAICHHLSLGKSPESIMTHFGLKRLGNIAKHHATLIKNNRK